MDSFTLSEGMVPLLARVPSTKPISYSMVDKSFVDAGMTLKRLVKKALNFDFDSLVKGDEEGARFTVFYNNRPLNLKVYRPLTKNGRFVRLTLDSGLMRTTSLAIGDVMYFENDPQGRIILTIKKNSGFQKGSVRRGKSSRRPVHGLARTLLLQTEGDIRRHETWERTRCKSAAKIVKQLEMQRVGRLRCHGCGMDPVKAYGVEVIEAHHRVPLSELKESRIPNPGDFDLLCPSCHRAIHRLVPPDLLTLRAVLKRQGR
jgi:hypothetical protein